MNPASPQASPKPAAATEPSVSASSYWNILLATLGFAAAAGLLLTVRGFGLSTVTTPELGIYLLLAAAYLLGWLVAARYRHARSLPSTAWYTASLFVAATLVSAYLFYISREARDIFIIANLGGLFALLGVTGMRGGIVLGSVASLMYLAVIVLHPTPGTFLPNVVNQVFQVIAFWGVGIVLSVILERVRRRTERLETLTRAARTGQAQLQEQVEQLKRDVHHRSKVIDEQTTHLQAAIAQAKETDRLKSEFLSNISHELRTPLTSIMGFSNLLLEQPDIADEAAEFARIINSQGQRLFQLINDILDITRIEEGRVELHPEPDDLNALIKEVIDGLRPQIDHRRHALDVNLDSQLPMAPMDRLRIQQVLWNLLGNSIKFTPENGSLTVSTRQTESHVIAEIQDTGHGISPDEQAKIFERFQQVDGSTTRKEGGTGLGLSIAQALVRLHGGSLWVTSREGVGSRFTFSIPKNPAKVDARPDISVAATSVAEPKTHSGDRQSPRILVIDDDPKVATLVRGILGANYQVEWASNGRDGVRMVKEIRPRLVFMDISMPVMDGLEATLALRESGEFKSLPIIALTAMTSERDRALRAGCNAFIAKPFTPTQIRHEIIRHIG